MNEEPLNPEISKMLKEMEPIFKQHNIDFYIVGAMARDIQLSSNPKLRAIRGTKDVDLAIYLSNEEQFYLVKESLVETGIFKEHKTEPIKLYYNNSIEVDLLPFGEIENELRETHINKPRVFVIDMPGFQEAYCSVTTIEVSGTILNVCSLEGLVLLKLIAHDDRPSRTKDISDIEHIIKAYFDLTDETIYKEYDVVLELYDTENRNYLQLVSANVIGRKIKTLLVNSADLKARVEAILRKRPTELWLAMLNGFLE